MVQLSRAGRVENRFGELFQRGVQGTEVVANVRVGPGLVERDRTEHPRMTPVRPILFANRTSELATSPLTAIPVTLDKEGTGGRSADSVRSRSTLRGPLAMAARRATREVGVGSKPSATKRPFCSVNNPFARSAASPVLKPITQGDPTKTARPSNATSPSKAILPSLARENSANAAVMNPRAIIVTWPCWCLAASSSRSSKAPHRSLRHARPDPVRASGYSYKPTTIPADGPPFRGQTG